MKTPFKKEEPLTWPSHDQHPVFEISSGETTNEKV